MQELLYRLGHGPSSLAGWLVLAPGILVLLGWFGAALPNGDDAPDRLKKQLGSQWNITRYFAPPSFIKFTCWLFPCLALLYVISVLL